MDGNLSKDLEVALEFIKHIDEDSITFDCCKMVEEGYMWDLRKHSHNVIEMIYMIDAKAHIDTKEKTLYPTWCDMVVYPPHHMHQEYIDPKHSQKCIYIRFDAKSTVDLLEPFQIKDKEGKLHWLIEEIALRSKEVQHPTRDKLILTYIKALLWNMELYFETLSLGKQEIVNGVVNYIRYNYAECLTVDKLAALFYVSPSYLSRLFHKSLNISPMNYVNTVRIEVAKKLLSFGTESVNTIAATVGIEDPKYFSRIFKKHVGSTPTEFRKKRIS